MKLGLDLNSFKKMLAPLKPIARHHYFIVTVLLFGSLAYAIYTVNETLNMPADSTYYDDKLKSTIGRKFNQSTKDTIEKIKQLQRSTDPTSPNQPFPEGRINPFAE
jgi:hypothetical protein